MIAVSNPDGKLLPGMTATVQFLTGSASDVLTVPNAALRYRPTPEQMAEAGMGTAGGAARRDSSARGGGPYGG